MTLCQMYFIWVTTLGYTIFMHFKDYLSKYKSCASAFTSIACEVMGNSVEGRSV